MQLKISEITFTNFIINKCTCEAPVSRPRNIVNTTILGHSRVIRSHILPPLRLQMHEPEVALALHERVTDRRYYERNSNTNQPTNKK